MNAYLEILRPSVLALAVFAVIVGALVVGFYDPFQIFIAILVVFMISGAGNATNDYYDYKIDKINKPKRPIPSGRIKRKNVAIYAGSLYIIANLLAIIFLNIYMIALAIFNTIITFLYAGWIKRNPLGHFIDSWLAASTFIFGALLIRINAIAILLFVLAYCANLGREIAKAIEDVKGDKKFGAKTLAVVAGKHFSTWIAIIFVFFAILISPLPYLFGLLNIYYLVLVIIADLVFAYSCFVLVMNPSKSQKIMKLAMFIAIIAFLIGTLSI